MNISDMIILNGYALYIRNIKWKMNGFSNYITLLHRSKYSFPFHFIPFLRGVGPYPTTQHHVFGEYKHINNIEIISKIVQIKPSSFVAFFAFFLFIWQRKKKKLFAPFHANRERIFVTRERKRATNIKRLTQRCGQRQTMSLTESI